MKFLMALLCIVCSRLAAQTTFETSLSFTGSAEVLDVAQLPGDKAAGLVVSDDFTAFERTFLTGYQNDGQLVWQRSYQIGTNNLFDFRRMRPTADGGLVLIGDILNTSVNSTYDPFIMKTDSVGNPQWTKIYTSTRREIAYNIHPTSDGGFISCGNSYVPSTTDYDFFLLKTDSLGNREWGKRYSYPFNAKVSPRDVHEDLNQDYYLCGNGGDSALVMKVSHTGQLLWARHLPMQSFGSVYSIEPSHAPDAFVCTGIGSASSFVFEMDTLGAIRWMMKYSISTGIITLSDLCRWPGGGYRVVGRRSANQVSQSPGVFMHVDSAGQATWCKELMVSAGVFARVIDTLPNAKGCLIGGYHHSGLDYLGYLARTDSAGKLDCNEQSVSVTATPDTIITDLIPMTEADDYTAIPYVFAEQAGGISHFVVCFTTAMSEAAQENFHAWPVPVRDELFVEFPNDANWQLRLTDALGRTALQENVRGSKHVLQLGGLPKGFYLLSASDGKKEVRKKIIRE